MDTLITNEKYSQYYKKIRLVYQRPEIKASLEVILSVFAVIILIFAAIRPTLTNIATLQKKIADQIILNKKAENKIAELFKAQSQLSEFGNQIKLFDSAIPDNYSYFQMAGRLEYLATQNGVTLENINMPGIKTFGPDSPKTEWANDLLKKNASNIFQPDVNFTITGKPEAVIKMISDLENMDTLTMINNITFSKELTKIGEPEILKAAGKIYFYFYEPGT